MKRFGRSTFPIVKNFVFMVNTFGMIFRTLFKAVAVNGTLGNKDPKMVSYVSAGRKSCLLVQKEPNERNCMH